MLVNFLNCVNTPIYIGTLKDCLSVILCAVAFWLIFIFHKHVLPKDYFSLSDVIYFFDLKHLKAALTFRFFLIACVITVAVFVFQVNFINVYISLLLVGMSQVLPVILRYDLFMFWKSKTRFIYLTCAIGYIILLWILGFICLQFIIPVFTNQSNIFGQGEAVIKLISGAAVYVISLIISEQAARNVGHIKDKFSKDRMHFLHADTLIMLRNLDILSADRGGVYLNYKEDIESFAKKYSINPELFKTILLIEEFNRGGWCYQLIERLCTFFLWPVVLKMDMSLGIGQLKISTAANIEHISKGEALKLLSDPLQSMEISAKYIHRIREKYDEYLLALVQGSQQGHVIPGAQNAYEDWYDFVALHYIGAASNTVYECSLYAEVIRCRCLYASLRENT